MALVPVVKPTYPNIPNAPGAPSVLRRVGAVQSTAVLLVADGARILNLFSGPKWGVFTASGAPAFGGSAGGLAGIVSQITGGTSQAFGAIEFRNSSKIANAPQEQGAFLSYNKVSDPYETRVVYFVGGTSAQKTAFLTQVEQAQALLTLYTVATPERAYPNCNVVHHSYKRAAHGGATLLAIEIWLEQVRIVGGPQYSNTATPAGADTANSGTVQPQAPSIGDAPGGFGHPH